MEYLPKEAGCPVFVNADLIAVGISPFSPETAAVKAGKLMLEEINHHAGSGASFAFETTLSGKMYARLIPEWRRKGYRVKLIFLSLPSADVALARVAARVALGGHTVPEEVVRRRFTAGLANFREVYQRIVDAWLLYDNSGPTPVLVAKGGND